ncbi:MAG: chemotaxis response regulator protein-glutamate methylesterase [Thermoanaerobacteraceae bacterium]|nr:chemotaxis response regulator protein-glutamate methylesterase [Thermoanaerobacteraceae bacterium]
MSRPIKVLVADDSAFMRLIITNILEQEPDIDVVGFARNGQEALKKIERLHPDVVTMDVEMPVLDGLAAVKEIMNTNPVPVVMLSSHTVEGAETTIKALEAGAVDFVTKPTLGSGMEDLAPVLLEKIRAAATASVCREDEPCIPGEEFTGAYSLQGPISVVVIGTSTGGPSALQKVLPKLPGNLPVPVIVIQHMPKGFTAPLAQRLNTSCSLTVKEAEAGEEVVRGKVLIAPAGKQLLLERKGSEVRTVLREKVNYKTLFKPSVDVTMMSAAEVFGRGTLGVILTGMGHDGTEGLRLIKEKQGLTIAQDKNSCVVYGMPRSAVEAGVVDRVVPLNKIAAEISRLVAK